MDRLVLFMLASARFLEFFQLFNKGSKKNGGAFFKELERVDKCLKEKINPPFTLAC